MAVIRSYLELLRVHNCLLAAASVWVGNYLCPEPVSTPAILPGMAIIFLVCGFGNALNDLRDIKGDRINHPGRPLPAGRLTPIQAQILIFTLIVAILPLCLIIQSATRLIVLSSLLALIWYNFQLKRIPLAGNLAVSVLAGTAFVVGGTENGLPDLWQFPGPAVPALFAGLMHLAREMIKDLQDVEGDKETDTLTLPIFFGSTITLIIASILLLLLAMISVSVYLLGWFGFFYFMILVVAFLIPMAAQMVWFCRKPDRFRAGRVASLLRLEMLAGLVALVVGKSY